MTLDFNAATKKNLRIEYQASSFFDSYHPIVSHLSFSQKL
jgi:hypothetical protein